MTHLRPLAAIRAHKQVSRASVSKALGLAVAKIEYFEEHAPLTTLEYLVNLKRALGLSWSAVGALLDQTTTDSRIQAAPLRGRGRPRKNQNSSAEQSPSSDQLKPEQSEKTARSSKNGLANTPKPGPSLALIHNSAPHRKNSAREKVIKPQQKLPQEESVRASESIEPSVTPPKRPRGRPRKQPDVKNLTLSSFLDIK